MSGMPMSLLRLPLVASVGGLPREAGSDQLLERRLAVAAGDADDSRIVFAAPRGAEATERHFRVVDRDLRERIVYPGGDHGAGRALLPRGADVVAAVEVRPLQREEELAVAQRTGVRADADKLPVFAVQFAEHRHSSFGERRDHASPSLACSTVTAMA
jgi:hypothetical protein